MSKTHRKNDEWREAKRRCRLSDEDAGLEKELGAAPIDPCDLEDLLPQWDTSNEEAYFVRESDGKVFSLEEAGRCFMNRDDALRRALRQDGHDDESVAGN